MTVRGRLHALEKALAVACPACRGEPDAVLLAAGEEAMAPRTCQVCGAAVPLLILLDPYAEDTPASGPSTARR